jgi:hypothetical protein
MAKKIGPDGASTPFVIRPGEDAGKLVERAYRFGRTYGEKKPFSDNSGSRKALPVENVPGWELDPKNNSNAVQAPEDKHAPNYANDTDGWLRGHGKNPFFDETSATGRRKETKS